MQKLVQLITKYQSGIEQVAAVVITLCAVVFISILLVKAMKDFSGGSLGEALMAYMSFKGITILLEGIAPDTGLIPKGLAINQQILDKVPFTKL